MTCVYIVQRFNMKHTSLQIWLQSSVCYLLHAGFLLGSFSNTRFRWRVPLKHQLTFTRPHGFISQKTKLFIITDKEPQILYSILRWRDYSSMFSDSRRYIGSACYLLHAGF
jgi:hypothetical protein